MNYDAALRQSLQQQTVKYIARVSPPHTTTAALHLLCFQMTDAAWPYTGDAFGGVSNPLHPDNSVAARVQAAAATAAATVPLPCVAAGGGAALQQLPLQPVALAAAEMPVAHLVSGGGGGDTQRLVPSSMPTSSTACVLQQGQPASESRQQSVNASVAAAPPADTDIPTSFEQWRECLQMRSDALARRAAAQQSLEHPELLQLMAATEAVAWSKQWLQQQQSMTMAVSAIPAALRAIEGGNGSGGGSGDSSGGGSGTGSGSGSDTLANNQSTHRPAAAGMVGCAHEATTMARSKRSAQAASLDDGDRGDSGSRGYVNSYSGHTSGRISTHGSFSDNDAICAHGPGVAKLAPVIRGANERASECASAPHVAGAIGGGSGGEGGNGGDNTWGRPASATGGGRRGMTN